MAGKTADSAAAQLSGDKLVGLKSALRQHKNPAKNLNFKPKNTWVAFENTHLELLSDPEVYSKIKLWMMA